MYSGRGTFNRQTNVQSNQGNTMNSSLTMDQLRQVFQFRMSGNGPYFVAASAIGTDGRAVAPDGSAAFAGQAFTMPAAGTIGTLGRRIFDGPWDTTFNFALNKNFKLTERNVTPVPHDRAEHPESSDVRDRRSDGDLDHLRQNHQHLRGSARIPVRFVLGFLGTSQR